MAKKLHLGVSPLTKSVYVGHLIENGTVWGVNKQDVTADFLNCIIDKFGPGEEIKSEHSLTSADGKPLYKLEITRL